MIEIFNLGLVFNSVLVARFRLSVFGSDFASSFSVSLSFISLYVYVNVNGGGCVVLFVEFGVILD